MYAKVELIEKRLYLLCRCEETAGNNDIKELQHNWSLRLDRIQKAELIEIARNWENDLQKIIVEFHLFGRLALNYEQRPEDISVETKINENEKTYTQVKRKIFSTFWFYRDMAGYWENCEIIAPDNVRQKFITEKLQLLVQKYHL